MEQKWFRLLLDDYSVPAITTADKEYYGRAGPPLLLRI